MTENWIDVVAGAAARCPDKPAFEYGGEQADRLTYAELDRRARAIAANLQRLGYTDKPVLLVQPPGLDFLATFLGCLYARVIAAPASVPSGPRRGVDRLAGMARDSGAVAVLTTRRVLARLATLTAGAGELAALPLVPADEFPTADAAGWERPSVGPGTTAFLQYTSGSTAEPRGVVVTNGNLLHNSRLIRRAFGTSGETRAVSWLPLYHDMGLIGGALQTIFSGATCTLMAPSAFARDPLEWIREISRTRSTVSGGPNSAFDLCANRAAEATDLASLDLSSWKVAFTGAEPVNADTMRRFTRAFAPYGFRAEAWTPCYGLAEASLMVASTSHDESPVVELVDPASLAQGRPEPADGPHAQAVVGAGRVCAGQRLEIVDPATGTPKADGEVGEIWLTGPSVAQGYWGRPEESARTFDAALSGEPATRFLRTGDLGYLRGGQLFVTGRAKDVIIVRGANHYPQDIERTAQSAHPALDGLGGAAFTVDQDGGQRLVVVHEVPRHHPAEELAGLAGLIRAAVVREHELAVHAVALIRAGLLPRTSSGKVQRFACRDGYRAGELALLAHDTGGLPAFGPRSADTVPVDPAADPVRAQLALVTGRHDLPVDVPLIQLGLDSLSAVELSHRLEKALGMTLQSVDLFSRSIAELTELAAATAAADTAPAATAPADASNGPAADRAPQSGDFPLSFNQRGIWLSEQLAPGSPAYLISAAARVHGPVDPAALRRALDRLADRHAALRTTFPMVDGTPVQRVHGCLSPVLTCQDATGWADDVLQARVEAAAVETFDTAGEPLLRLTLFGCGPDDHRLVLSVHHLVADMWSLSVLTSELDVLYTAELAGDGEAAQAALPPALPYPEFARRQSDLIEGPGGQLDWTFWQERLADAPKELELPTDLTRPAARSLRGAGVPVTVAPEVTARLKAIAAERQATLYQVVLAAFQLLLWRQSGQRDVVVASPVHGRQRADLARSIGCFVNTVALRTRIEPAEDFPGLVARVRETSDTAFRHADFPFTRLVELLQPDRDATRSPLAQAMFTFHQPPGESGTGLAAFFAGRADAALAVGPMTLRPLPLPTRAAQFDLHLHLVEYGDELTGELRYGEELFTPAGAARLGRQLTTLLGAVADAADRPVAELSPLAADEWTTVLDRWNATGLAYDRDGFAHRLFEAQARRTPDACAIRSQDGGGELDYAELDRRSTRVAHRLVALGVVAETVVAVHVSRSPGMAAAVLGVLKAGGVVLPLGDGLPARRVELMLADAGVTVAVTDRAHRPYLPADLRVVDVDGPDPDGTGTDGPESRELPDPGTDADRAAYLIYTSGSTGRPKGAVLTHRNVVNFLAGARELFALKPGDRWLAVATLSFDLAVFELLAPLTSGATVLVAGRELAVDGRALREALEDGGVTHLQGTPATWQLLLDAGWERAPGLTMITGGDALRAAVARRLLDTGGSLWNMYGPTETTVYSTGGPVDPGAGTPRTILPLGRPMANQTVYLLDQDGRPVAPGAIGEIHIGGDGVTRGYFGRPGLTAERFVPDPFSPVPGRRLYRSGDLGRHRPDGTLEFAGRADNQVKLRGYRIEPGEIEAVLRDLDGVARAAVKVFGTELLARLVAYVEPDGEPVPRTAEQLRRALGERLPSYMVPSVIQVVDRMPMTARGKIDRSALPEPYGEATDRVADRDAIPPASATERALAELVAGMLEIPGVGRDEDLFALGAHSLLMSRLVARIREDFGTELPLSRLFTAPTVAGIAELVDRDRASADRAAVAAPVVRRADRSQYRADRGRSGAAPIPGARQKNEDEA
ncbi:amino acid adenylation domain-containing protein [Kitasatospora sp. NPDC085464]|uniref:amino acid adenylation domain-containing protein n=1 Tax=Kitasatospora sp. NPDC085464 TaxID=3364063 RepID=UPI0037CB6D72